MDHHLPNRSNNPFTIETVPGGILVDLRDPHPEQIRIEDIAHSLSRLQRYNGYTEGEHGYSVAQHCVWMAAVAEEHFSLTPQACLSVLLHDAHEAYMGDITTPLKRLVTEMLGSRNLLNEIAERLQTVIHRALNVGEPDRGLIAITEELDHLARAAEIAELKVSGTRNAERPAVSREIRAMWRPPLAYARANALFLTAYRNLRERRTLLPLWHALDRVAA